MDRNPFEDDPTDPTPPTRPESPFGFMAQPGAAGPPPPQPSRISREVWVVLGLITAPIALWLLVSYVAGPRAQHPAVPSDFERERDRHFRDEWQKGVQKGQKEYEQMQKQARCSHEWQEEDGWNVCRQCGARVMKGLLPK